MSKKKAPSLTQRVGGNKAIVLGIVMLMLVLFTVDLYLLPALGVDANRPDFVRFTVDGRAVTVPRAAYQTQFTEWHQFHAIMGNATRDEFLTELMLAELAADAGIEVTDGTLRAWIESYPIFTDSSGRFDPEKFDRAREQYFGGISVRALEQQARRYLLVDQYRKMYGNSFLMVTDGEAHERWKREHPKVAIAYAWQPTAPLREKLGPSDLEDAEVERYWSNPRVQEKYKLPKRYRFRASFVNVQDTDDRAYLEARLAWQDEPGLRLKEGETLAYWNASREYDFDLRRLDGKTVDRLREENRTYDAWEKEHGPFPTEPADEEAAPVKEAAPGEGDGEGEPADGSAPAPEGPPDALPPGLQFERYWRFRLEKEIWLRRLMERILATARAEVAADPAVLRPLEGATEKWTRGRLVPGFVDQVEPVDQYGVEKVAGLGGPTRFAMNTYRPADEGKFHDTVLPQSNVSDDPAVRGWVVFRVMEVLEPEVPALDAVRERVVGELLDARAAEVARTRLEKARKEAEDSRRPLAEVAAEIGLEVGTAGPFNEFSWRPPLPRTAPGESPPPAAGAWKDPARRLSAIMGKYFFFREVPVGSFAAVVDDASGSGAFYLVQVRERVEPAFEEMTEAQVAGAKRQIRQERAMRVGEELGYGALKDRLGLQVDGRPAPEPGGDHGG